MTNLNITIANAINHAAEVFVKDNCILNLARVQKTLEDIFIDGILNLEEYNDLLEDGKPIPDFIVKKIEHQCESLSNLQEGFYSNSQVFHGLTTPSHRVFKMLDVVWTLCPGIVPDPTNALDNPKNFADFITKLLENHKSAYGYDNASAFKSVKRVIDDISLNKAS